MNQQEWVIFGAKTVLNMEAMQIDIKHYHLNNRIRRYLQDIISNLKKSDTWKIELTIDFNFNFPKDNDEGRVMHLKIDNMKIGVNDKADEVIKKSFSITSF